MNATLALQDDEFVAAFESAERDSVADFDVFLELNPELLDSKLLGVPEWR